MSPWMFDAQAGSVMGTFLLCKVGPQTSVTWVTRPRAHGRIRGVYIHLETSGVSGLNFRKGGLDFIKGKTQWCMEALHDAN